MPAGNAYVTGETLSADFPTTAGAFRRTYRGDYDMFVDQAERRRVGARLLDVPRRHAGRQRRADRRRRRRQRVRRWASPAPPISRRRPAHSTGRQTAASTSFVTKAEPVRIGLVYSTYLGGQGFRQGGGLAVDDAGERVSSSAAPDRSTSRRRLARFDTPPDGSDAFVTKLNAAGSALVYSAVFGGSASEGASGDRSRCRGQCLDHRRHDSADFPTTADAADRSLERQGRRVHLGVERQRHGALYSTLLGGSQSDVGNDVAVDAIGDVYVTGHTYSLDFPATVGAFDTVCNGDLSIFWGDAFVTKIASAPTLDAPVAPPATPAAPALLAPANGDTPPQPITFDWSDVTSAVSYTIQIDDSSAFTAPLVRQQTVTTLDVRDERPRDDDALLARARRQCAGVAGRVVGCAQLHAAGGAAPAGPGATTRHQSVDGGRAATVSSGTVVLSVGRPDGGAAISLSSSHPAVASVPASTTAPANSFTASFTIATAAVVVEHDRHDHRHLQRHDANRRRSPSTRPGSSSSTPDEAVVVNPATVSGGSSAQGAVVLAAARRNRDERRALEQQRQCSPRVPASVTVPAGSRRRGLRDLDERRERVHPGDDHGDLERGHEDREPDGDAGVARPPPRADRDPDGDCQRPQWRAGHVEPRRHQRRQRAAAARRRSPSARRSPLRVSDGRRRDLVRRLLERRQQDDQLHLHAERRVDRERERAVTLPLRVCTLTPFLTPERSKENRRENTLDDSGGVGCGRSHGGSGRGCRVALRHVNLARRLRLPDTGHETDAPSCRTRHRVVLQYRDPHLRRRRRLHPGVEPEGRGQWTGGRQPREQRERTSSTTTAQGHTRR